MERFGITTDETLRETARHGNDRYPFQFYLEDIWSFDFHCINWHWHPEMELVYVREGTALCCVGTEQMEVPAGGGLFVNSGVLHRFLAQSSTIIPNMVFSPALLAPEGSLLYEKYIRPIVASAAGYQVLSPEVPWERDALHLLRQIIALQDAPQVSELSTVILHMELWRTLSEHLETSEKGGGAQGPNQQQARLRLMMQFIHDNYARELTLEDIAASASVGKSSALHSFQSGIQMSPVAYLIQYRLSQAAQLLCHTQKLVATIADEVGFTSAGYFCRKFRQRYGLTPNEYRRKRA